MTKLNNRTDSVLWRKLPVDQLPVIMVPLLILLAQVSDIWSYIVFPAIVVGLHLLKGKFEQIKPRSTFFIAWFISSILSLILIFNTFVIGLLEILPEENFTLVLLMIVSLGCLYHTKMRSQKTLLPFNKASYINGELNDNDFDDMTNVQLLDQPFFCRHCHANVQNKNHCVWLNCCIGPENEKLFILGNIFGLLALIYGSNLTLTTVCHPFIFYYPYIRFLLPDDCSDVYATYSTSFAFVSATYSVIMFVHVGWFLLRTLFKKLGCTGFRWNCNALIV